MPPTSDRDFLSAAGQRLEAAITRFKGGLTLDAQYVGGYVVECSIKAVILHHTPAHDLAEMLGKLSSGAKMHKSEVLLGVLRGLGVTIPSELAKRHVRFVKTWATDLRYETGRRDTGETKGFLKTVAALSPGRRGNWHVPGSRREEAD